MALSGIALQHADNGYSKCLNFSGALVCNMVSCICHTTQTSTVQEGESLRGRGQCGGLKVVTLFLGRGGSRHLLFICSDTFAVACIL